MVIIVHVIQVSMGIKHVRVIVNVMDIDHVHVIYSHIIQHVVVIIKNMLLAGVTLYGTTLNVGVCVMAVVIYIHRVRVIIDVMGIHAYVNLLVMNIVVLAIMYIITIHRVLVIIDAMDILLVHVTTNVIDMYLVHVIIDVIVFHVHATINAILIGVLAIMDVIQILVCV